MNLLKMSASECLWLCLDVLMLFASAEGEPGSRIKVVVREGSDAILPCSLSTKESIVEKVFNWRKVYPNKQEEVFRYNRGTHYNNGLPGQDEHFRGRVSHFPLELQSGNASIIIENTMVPDSGNYTCDLHLQPKQTFTIELVVEPVMRDRSREIDGAAAKPIVHVLNISEDQAVLKCEVRDAFPKPKVEWRDRDGNILHAEEQVSHIDGRYNITLLTTVTRTNISPFVCVATQEVIRHVTEEKLYVPFCGTCGQVIAGLVGWFIGILSLALVLAVLLTTGIISISCNRGFLRNVNSSSEETTAPGSETGPEETNALHNGSVV